LLMKRMEGVEGRWGVLYRICTVKNIFKALTKFLVVNNQSSLARKK